MGRSPLERVKAESPSWGKMRNLVPDRSVGGTLWIVFALAILMIIPSSVAGAPPSSNTSRSSNVERGNPFHGLHRVSPEGLVPAGTSMTPLLHHPLASGREYVVNFTTFLTNGTVLRGNWPAYTTETTWSLAYDPVTDGVYSADHRGLAFENVSSPTAAGFLRIPAKNGATAVTYDPFNGQLYAADEVSGLYETDPSTGKVLQAIPVGSSPVSMVYDPENHNLYVISYANQYPGEVDVLSDTNSLITSLSFGGQLSFGAFDPDSHAVVVTSEGLNQVSAINDTTEQVVHNIGVGNLPDGIAYDPLDHTLWVADGNGNNVEVLNATTYVLETTITNITDAGSLVYDPADGSMIIGQMIWQPICCTVGPGNGVDRFSIADAATNAFTRSINTTSPIDSLVWVPSRGEVWGLQGVRSAIAWNATTFTQVPIEPLLSSPIGLMADPTSSNVWVADNYASRLTEIGDQPGKILQNLTTDTGPYDIAYDPDNQIVYASQDYQASVSALNLSSGTLLPSIPVLQSPEGIVFDPVNQEVYVADYSSGSATAIYARNDTVAASIGVGGALPDGAFFDPVTDQILVSISGAGTLAVINPQNNTVLTHIHLGSAQPGPILYDPATHSLYAANAGSNNLTVLNATTYRSTASLPAGDGPVALTLNTSSGDIFIADSGSSSVSVVNPVTGSLLQTLPVGINPEGIYYDPTSTTVLVANAGTGSISYLGTAPMLQLTSFNESASTVNVGTSVTFTLATQGGAPPLNYSYAGLPPGCVSQSIAPLTCQPSVAGWFNITGYAGDTGGTLVNAKVTLHVLPILYLQSFVAHGSILDLGGSTTLYANVSYGTAPYAYLYTSLPAGCSSANSSTLSCTPTITGTFTVHVNVTDSSKTVVEGNTTLLVNPVPSIQSFAASPSSLQVGNTTLLSATVTGGTGYLSYSYGGLPTGCGSLNVSVMTCIPSGVGNFSVTLTLQDALGKIATSTTPVNVMSAPPLFSALLSSSLPVFDLGGSTYLNASTSGGNAPFTYVYNGLPTGCSSSNTPSVDCTPTSAGAYLSVSVAVTDGLGKKAVSTGLTITVNPLPSLQGFTVIPGTIPTNGTTYLNVSISGGTAPYVYSYAGLPPGCTSQNVPDLVCTPPQAGLYQVKATVVDSDGKSITSPAVNLTVSAPSGFPTVTSFSATPNPVTVDQPTAVAIAVSGGTTPYSYVYLNLPPGCTTSNSSTLSCTPTSPGNYSVQATITDSNGHSAKGTLSLVVTGAVQSLSVVLVANVSVTTVGLPFLLTAQLSGGVGPFAYVWELNGTNLSSSPDTATFSVTQLHPGNYTYGVWVTDSRGTVTLGGPLTVGVFPVTMSSLVSVTLSPANTTLDEGGTRTFTATVSCGSLPCRSGVFFAWTLSDPSLGSLNVTTGATVQFIAASAAGTETITVTATLNGVTRSSATSVTILASTGGPPGPGGFLGLSSDDWLLILIVVIIVIGIAAVLVVHRRKGRSNETVHEVQSGHVAPGYVVRGQDPYLSPPSMTAPNPGGSENTSGGYPTPPPGYPRSPLGDVCPYCNILNPSGSSACSSCGSALR